MTTKKVIGLSGGAGSGKDTFFNILNTIVPCKRFALADALKSDLRDSLLAKYGIDVFNCSFDDKNIIRPELVAYGKLKRDESKGTYWTDLVQKLIEAHTGDELIVITDIRYNIFPEDEFFWLTKKMSGQLVFIQNYWMSLQNKVFPQPINRDEEVNNQMLRELANYYVEWPVILSSQSTGKEELHSQLKPYVQQFYAWFERQRPNL